MMKLDKYFTDEMQKLFVHRLGKEFVQKLLKLEFHAFIYIACSVYTIFNKRNNPC